VQRYSAFSLVKHAMGHHLNWQRVWRNPEPKRHYDVIVIGGGGHGLATAYYLAKVHGLKNIAVIEKGYLGGAIRVAIPRLFDRTTSGMKPRICTSMRLSFGKRCL